ncbi:MAG: carboxypeptidase regulatory-like domain-containing protein [Planctomycetota bacterium]
MKSWPLILVILLLGLSAFIVLGTGSSTPTDSETSSSIEEAGTLPVGGIDGDSHREPEPAGAIGRTDAEVVPTDASMKADGPNALPFSRPAAHLGMKLVDGEGKGVADATVSVHLTTSLSEVPGVDAELWGEQNQLQVDTSGKLQAEVPSDVGMHLKIHGPHWFGTNRQVQALSAGEEVDLGEIALAPANLVTGMVRDASGAVIPGARVALEEANGAMWGDFERMDTKAEDDGSYAFQGVRRGRYQVTASAQGYAKLVLEAQDIDQVQGDFVLDLTLERGKAIRGQVVSPEGQPIEGAQIYHLSIDQPGFWGTAEWRPGLPSEEDVEPGAISDASGYFEVYGMTEEGTHYLGARAEGFGTGYAETVAIDSDAVIQLPRHYVLSGKVLDSNGNPIAGASLNMSILEETETEHGWGHAVSEEDGSYAFEPLPPGSWTLTLDSSFGEITDQAVQLSEETEALDLILPVQNPLHIRVVDQDGNPIQGVSVSLADSEGGHHGMHDEVSLLSSLSYAGDVSIDFGNFHAFGMGSQRTAVTDQEGIARFADLEAKRYKLHAEELGYADLQEDLDVTGTPQEEEVTMVQGGRLRLTLVDGAGAPVANVPVGLRTTQEGEDLQQRTTDSAGRAVWNNLEEADYEVSYRANEASGWWWDNDESEDVGSDRPVVQVKAGKTTDRELTVGDLALLTVRVTRNGQPASDVKVHLREITEEERYYYGGDHSNGRPTDGRGEVELPPVDAGKYDIVVKGQKSSPATEKKVDLYVGPQVIDVELDGGEVRGSLMGTNGPLAGATVALTPYQEPGSDGAHRNMGMTVISYSSGSDGRPSLKFGKSGEQDTNTRSNGSGAYRFTDVPDGEWQVVARADGFGTWSSQPITMRGGQVVEMGDHRLFPGAVIRGHDHNHVPRGDDEDMFFGWGESVYLNDGDGMMINLGMIDNNGDYVLEDLPEGTYTIRKGSFVSDPIELSAGAERRIDIPMEEPEEEVVEDKEQ